MKNSESKSEILRVIDLSRGGAGVAKSSTGKIYFIPWSAPGDLVKVNTEVAHRKYNDAIHVELLELSPMRVSPKCKIFQKCGGCQWQHIPYSLQWKTKVKSVLHQLHKQGLTENPLLEEYPAERIWEYRNRVQLRGVTTPGQAKLGFFRSRSNQLIFTDRCEISRPEINQAWPSVIAEASKFKSPSLKVEIEVLEDGTITSTWDAPHSSRGFQQVHSDQNLKLREWLFNNLTEGETLFDFFGGSGNLSIDLTNKMKRILCIDRFLSGKKRVQTPDHFEFCNQSVVPWIQKNKSYLQNLYRSRAITDPPRSGLGKSFMEIEKFLNQVRTQEWILIGCDLDSWSRDLFAALKKNWKLQKIALFDFFPQTIHLECVAKLSKEFTS